MPDNIPQLEDRFLEPDGWQWGRFTREGREIRFGSVSPKNKKPEAIVVCLSGLSEFAEKYFEVARTCVDQNYSFWTLDWMGQGGSGRYLENPHKRHSSGFDDDVQDLAYFIREHVDTGAPLVLLAHSMGGNLGLRYIAKHSDVFKCAAFSAPLMNIQALPLKSLTLNAPLTTLLSFIKGKDYVFGGTDWTADFRPENDLRFSTDPVRAEVHNTWCKAKPSLQVGSVTFGWLHEAVKSCLRLQDLKSGTIAVPSLIATAGDEHFVSNMTIENSLPIFQNCIHKNYPDAAHEILMEQSSIRDDFFELFFKLIKENTSD